MQSEFITRKPIERNKSDKIKGLKCNGCRFLTVLDRHRTSVIYGKKHREYYEEYYCNAIGKVIDPKKGCYRK